MMNPRSSVLHVLSALTAALAAACFLLAGCEPDSQPTASLTAPPFPPDAQTETRAAAGEVEAQVEVGRWHLGGAGQPRDYKAAAQWLAKAGQGGSAEAQYLMGTLCEAGGGVEQSATNALKWFQLAAAQQHAGALYNLGSMYAAGRGVPQDSTRAARLFLEAAELGDALAQFNVAQRFELGRGVSTNLVESWKWYSLAASGGVADAQQALPSVERRLSAEEIRAARRAVADFQRHALSLKRTAQ